MRDDHLAAVRLQKAHDVAERDGLANAAAPDDGYCFSGVHMKIAIDQDRPVERLVDMPELDVVGKFLTHGSIGPTRPEYSHSGTRPIRRRSRWPRADP